jgi:hypothetical protein
MKLLTIAIFLISTSSFSAEVGEDKKGECKFSNQSAKREAKVVLQTSQEEAKKEESKAIKK